VPIVAVDIDGTISEYHNHLAAHVQRYFNLSERPWGQWNGVGNFEDWLGVTREQYREAKLAFRQGGFKRWAPVMPGVPELSNTLEAMRTRGMVEVWITTTRPWNRLDSTDPDTRAWLDLNFPVYDHLLYHDNKYQELHRILDGASDRVIVVLEDLPPMYEEAVEHFGNAAFMVARPHNFVYRENNIVQEVSDLSEFYRTLTKRVDRWNDLHVTTQ
jgi:hypothetical protein